MGQFRSGNCSIETFCCCFYASLYLFCHTKRLYPSRYPATFCYVNKCFCYQRRKVSMSIQTRSRRRIYSRLISVFVRGSVSKLRSTALRQEWLQEIGSHLVQLGPSSKRIASIYCGKTTLLADDQLIKRRYFTFPVLKRVGPFGTYGCEPGPRYRYAAGLT